MNEDKNLKELKQLLCKSIDKYGVTHSKTININQQIDNLNVEYAIKCLNN